ncbi:MAG: hypothetical protein IH804_05805, partial [Planctomycetes bacterium]|nr:hypothetical protein [Planctomycetota bacterium]
TWHAYNDFGGRNLYTGGTAVSLQRPMSPGYLHKPPGAGRRVTSIQVPDPRMTAHVGHLTLHHLSPHAGSAGWPDWELPFMQWAEREGYAVDVVTNADLEDHPELLSGPGDGSYALYLSVGHDEYWSGPMRDTVEGFIARGGNAAFLSGNTAGAPGTLLSTVTLEIAGNLGVESLTIASGRTMSDVVTAINTLKESTGVSASLVNAADQTSGMTFNSIGYGSDQFVSIRETGLGGDFFSTHAAQGVSNAIERDTGADVSAIVNGALATGRGLVVSLNKPSLSLSMTLSTAYAQTTNSQKTFNITGGGATFQLGPNISSTQQVGFGIQSIAGSRLGAIMIDGVGYFLDSIKTGGANSIESGQARNAALVLDAAIEDVSILRGRLGAFERNTIQTNIRSLQIGLENITAAESIIRDADFAVETAAFTRAQVLVQAGTSVLATANLTAQNVLALLG